MDLRPQAVIAIDDDLVWDVLNVACARGGVHVVNRVRTYGDLLERCASVDHAATVIADRLGGTVLEAALPALLQASERVIVLSSDPSPERVCRLLANDVCGYLSHAATPTAVVAAIKAVVRGELAIEPQVLKTVMAEWRQLRSESVTLGDRRQVLTPREADILTAMCDGLAAKAIAARLGVATKTVENHKIRVFDKLGVRSQAEAVSLALFHGLAPGPVASSEVGDGC